MSFSGCKKAYRFCRTFAVLTAVALPLQAQAGFEWIPAPQPEAPQAAPQSAPQGMAVPPASVQTAPVPQAVADDAMLPLPGEELAPPPPQAVVSAPRPAVQNDGVPVVEVAPEPVYKAASQQIHAAPVQDAFIPMPGSASQQAEPIPRAQQVHVKHHVIMPEDAPANAVDKMQAIKLEAYPDSVDAQEDVLEPFSPMEAAAVNEPEPSPAPIPAPVMSAPPADLTGENVVGFGSDMPLALALRQVVPADFSFSFAQNVNPGQRVSWNGGKPWFEVVSDMVEPLGLIVQIKGKIVHVRPSHQAVNVQQPVQKMSAMEAVEDVQESVAQGGVVDVLTQAPQAQNVETGRQIIRDPGQEEGVQSEATLSSIREAAEVQEDVLKQEISEQAAVAPLRAPRVWQAHKGDSLKKTLSEWGQKSGYKVVWEADYDYPLQDNIMAEGRFEDALQVIVNRGMDDDNSPELVLGEGQDGEALIVVKDPVLG